MNPHDAVARLTEVHEIQRRARAGRPGMWFALLLFGSLALLSIPVLLRYGVGAQGLYWSIVGPVGGLATGLFSWLSGRRIGLELPGRAYMVAIGVILGGSVVAGALGGILGQPRVSVAGPPIAVCAGLVLIARATGSTPLVWLACLVAATDIGLLAFGVAARPSAIVLAIGYGLPALLLGARIRQQERP